MCIRDRIRTGAGTYTTQDPLAVGYGGTGIESVTQYGVLLGNGTGALTVKDPPASPSEPQILKWNGGAPYWGNDNTGSGTVTGSGTQNYITKFNNAAGDQIGDSRIFDNNTGAIQLMSNADLEVTGGDITGANSEAISLGVTDNVISFTSGGSERMRVHSNGYVGIGTTSPDGKLHVSNSAGNDARVYIERPTNAEEASIRFQTGASLDNDDWFLGLDDPVSGADNFRLYNYNVGDYVLTVENTTGKLSLTSGTGINEFSTDVNLAGNSDDAVPTEKAVKTYVDNNDAVNDADCVIGNEDITAFTWTEGSDLLRITDHAGNHDVYIDNEADDVTLTDVQNACSNDFHNIGGTDAQLTTEQVQDITGAMVTGNTETGITVTYQDADGTIDFVATDVSASNEFQDLSYTASTRVMAISDGTNATLPLFSTSNTNAGLVVGSNGVASTNFLRADGTWAVPPGDGDDQTASEVSCTDEFAHSNATNVQDVLDDLDQAITDGGTSEWVDAGTYLRPLDDAGANVKIYDNGTGKIDAAKVDPVIEIAGKQYATYCWDGVGLRTDVVGEGQLENGVFELHLAQQPEASDLWLFYNVVAENTIVPFVTPQDEAYLMARMEGPVLIVKAISGDMNARFSFRLSAKRIDMAGSTDEINIRTDNPGAHIRVEDYDKNGNPK